jgi:hypothetical protein
MTRAPMARMTSVGQLLTYPPSTSTCSLPGSCRPTRDSRLPLVGFVSSGNSDLSFIEVRAALSAVFPSSEVRGEDGSVPSAPAASLGAQSHNGGRNPTSAMDARTYLHSVPFLCTMGTQLTKSSVMQKNGSQQSSILAPLNSGSSTLFMRNPLK